MHPEIPLPLPWQEAQWEHLTGARAAGRLPHALLLAGPSGNGKRRLATALAAAVLCRSPTTTGHACSRCRACQLFAAGTHPDHLQVEPGGASQTIRVDAVRSVTEFVAQTAQQGGWKVVTLAPAESMNRNAANALLKCLEEPAGTTLLLLVADHPALLPATVRSRCRRLALPVPSTRDALAWLQGLAVDEDTARRALAEAGGRPLLARELSSPDAAELRTEWDARLLALLRGELDLVTTAGAWQEVADEQWLPWLIQRLQAGLRVAMHASEPETELDQVLGRSSPERLLGWLERLLEWRRQQLGGVVLNRQLALEAALIPACDPRHT